MMENNNGFKLFVDDILELGIDPFSQLVEDENEKEELIKLYDKTNNLSESLMEFYNLKGEAND